MHEVVIVGGGFGGLHAARSLRRAPVAVTLIDRRNHHLFQPLLYQVATGALSPANIAAPLRALLRRQPNARVLLEEVIGIDVAGRRVQLREGDLPYDSMILAAGSSHSYFGHDEWEKCAPGLKSIEDATRIRARLLAAFETAERLGDAATRRSWLTFVIVGGGPTGVELAGAVAELARQTLRGNFRSIDPASARICLVEAGSCILGVYPAELTDRAADALRHRGVEVLTGATVTAVSDAGVTIRRGDATGHIEARNVLWGAGVQASPLARKLSESTGASLDRGGRVHVQGDLTIAGHPEIFVIGDMAHFDADDGKPLPALAPVAMQQGRHVARLITRRLKGHRNGEAFRYRDKGTMATIGAFAAVADIRGLRFSGMLAWLVWLFVHLMQIVQFENRVLVFVQWAWHYTTRNRSARLITGDRTAGMNEDTSTGSRPA